MADEDGLFVRQQAAPLEEAPSSWAACPAASRAPASRWPASRPQDSGCEASGRDPLPSVPERPGHRTPLGSTPRTAPMCDYSDRPEAGERERPTAGVLAVRSRGSLPAVAHA